MEIILYYIMKSGLLLLSFLLLMFIIGVFSYLVIRVFKQDNKIKLLVYGLFLGLKDIDVVKIGVVVIKTFLIFYATFIIDRNLLIICLLMIIFASIIYIILSPKSALYEILFTLMQVGVLYFIYIIANYSIEVEDTVLITLMGLSLKGFVMIFAIYFFLRNINNIVEYRSEKEFSRIRKETDNAKQ